MCVGGSSRDHTTRVVTSSTEAECYAIIQAVKENRWVVEFLKEIDIIGDIKATIISQDNKSAIALAKNKATTRNLSISQ